MNSFYEFLGFDGRELFESDLRADASSWQVARGIRLEVRKPDMVLAKDIGVFTLRESEKNKDWGDVLARNQQIRYLESERVNQDLFDAICGLSALERLDIGGYRTTVEDPSRLARLTGLTHLQFGSTNRIGDFSVLGALGGLHALGIQGKFRKDLDLGFLGGLPSLKGLGLCGQDYYKQGFDSLKPLENCKALKYLSLIQVKILDGTLEPVAKLPDLEYFMMDESLLKQFPLRDYQAIYEGCPKLKGHWLKRAATNADFQKKYRIKS